MKTNNHKLKPFIAGSLLAVAIVAVPFVGFAKDNDKYDKELKAKLKMEAHAEKSNNSIWNRLWSNGWFGGSLRARAAANAKLTTQTTPNISSITAPTMLKTGQTGTWTVNASNPQNGSLTYSVDWGEKSNFFGLKSNESAFVQTSTFTHAYAKAGTYTVKFTVKNEAGKSATSTVTVHVSGTPVQTAPVISDTEVRAIGETQATIHWKTDVRSSGMIWYGTTSPTDTTGTPKILRKVKTFNHNIKLTDLHADTTYYVVVGSEGTGGKTLGTEISFKTKAAVDAEAPVITSITGDKTVEVDEEVKVTVNAYDPKNGSLTYSVDWGDSSNMTDIAMMAKSAIFTQTATFTHVYTEPGTYTATFKAKNEAGKEDTASVKITVTDEDEDEDE